MAEIKPSYSKADEIPEGLAGFYTEQSDGSFKINLAGGVKTEADVQKVKKVLDNERSIRQAQSKVLKSLDIEVYEDGSYDDEQVDSIKEAHQNYTPGGSGDGGDGDPEEVKALKTKVESLQTKLRDKDQEVEKEKEALRNTQKRSQVRDALVGAGVTDPILLDAAVDRTMSRHRVGIKDSEDGEWVVTAGDLDDPVEDWAKDWAKSDEGKRFVSAAGNSGGGAWNGGGGGNDSELALFKEGANRTQRGLLIREDPEKARKLAKQAGWTDHQVTW